MRSKLLLRVTNSRCHLQISCFSVIVINVQNKNGEDLEAWGFLLNGVVKRTYYLETQACGSHLLSEFIPFQLSSETYIFIGMVSKVPREVYQPPVTRDPCCCIVAMSILFPHREIKVYVCKESLNLPQRLMDTKVRSVSLWRLSLLLLVYYCWSICSVWCLVMTSLFPDATGDTGRGE